jgi:hypothetical protein
MNYLKYTQYIYLVFSVFFIYDGISKMNDGEETYWLSFLISGLAVFMFFFRRKFAKKFEDNSKSK